MSITAAPRAGKIITLGSPLHGARIAAVGAGFDPGECPVACQQLAPGSALLTRLQQSAQARPPWLSLWSTDDQTVEPPDSARLPGAVNVPLQSVCPGADIQHSQLPTAPLVVGIVLRALASDRVTAPHPAPARLSSPSAGDAQVVMSLVAKSAQAAPRKTTTYTGWMPNPRWMSRQKIGCRKKSIQASQYRVGK